MATALVKPSPELNKAKAAALGIKEGEESKNSARSFEEDKSLDASGTKQRGIKEYLKRG